MFIEALQQQRTDNPNHKFYKYSEVIDFYSRAVHVVSVLSPELKPWSKLRGSKIVPQMFKDLYWRCKVRARYVISAVRQAKGWTRTGLY